MTDLLSNEPSIRLAAFAVRKTFSPRHDFHPGRSRHLLNSAIVVLDAFIIRLAFPVTAVGLALLAETWRWGCFNASSTRALVSILLAVILLDLAINLQWRSPHILQSVPCFEQKCDLRETG